MAKCASAVAAGGAGAEADADVGGKDVNEDAATLPAVRVVGAVGCDVVDGVVSFNLITLAWAPCVSAAVFAWVTASSAKRT